MTTCASAGLRQCVLSADVIQATGDAICIFRELQCLAAGRLTTSITPTFLPARQDLYHQIPTPRCWLFLLPHKDRRQMFFVVSWGPAAPLGPREAAATGDLAICWASEPRLALSLLGPSPQISLDPPIKQVQTRYHFLILLFSKDEDSLMTLQHERVSEAVPPGQGRAGGGQAEARNGPSRLLLSSGRRWRSASRAAHQEHVRIPLRDGGGS